MYSRRKCRRQTGGAAALLGLLATLGAGASAAQAAGPPQINVAWASSVFSSSARLGAEINPNGNTTFYRFEYIAKAAYDANVGAGKDGFTGAARSPAGADASLGSGTVAVEALRLLSGLDATTTYRYRVVAHSSFGTETGMELTFTTRRLGGEALLPDLRGWEMVSPVQKNGGQVDPPGTLAGGGALQAAAAGGSVTYGSAASFGSDAQGAPGASQYIARRGAGGWSNENITAPLFSGSFGTGVEGVPYRIFSSDLARGLLLNGRHCRGAQTGCPVANPPLAGTGAPAGYQNYYLRESAGVSFAALLGPADVLATAVGPEEFEVSLAGASADLRHVVLSTCAALTPDAIETPDVEGCDSDAPNLYEYSSGSGLSLVNFLPGQSQGTPGANLAAPAGAVSTDGARVYWTDLATASLYLREGDQTRQVDEAAGGGGAFEAAATDGSFAFFTKGEHLWRYDADADTATDLTPMGGVAGVLGASEDGAYVYYQDATGLKLWHGAATTTVALGAGAAESKSYPPATGTARVSADGTRLLFVSTAPLNGYDNTDLNTGNRDSQVYLYDDTAVVDPLTCASCNPTGGRPIGPSTLPGAIANGTGPEATRSYKPRVLAAGGRRVYFDSRDALAATDTNADFDVYQWEARGTGSCTSPGGCASLISSGRSDGGATFVDAAADGADVFFLTEGSLIDADPGSLDLYDARVDGGILVPPAPIPCEGDACQRLPSEPVDPTLTTLLRGLGNPRVRYAKRCKRGTVKRKGKCVAKEHKMRPRGKRHQRRSGL